MYDQCHDGGVISPQTCIYLTQWLSMEGDPPTYNNNNNNNNQRRNPSLMCGTSEELF